MVKSHVKALGLYIAYRDLGGLIKGGGVLIFRGTYKGNTENVSEQLLR